MPHPSRYFELPKTSPKKMMREWMARQTEMNEQMKNQVVELECKIDQVLRNRQAIIENLERQFKYLEKTQHNKSLPRTKNTKLKHEFVYKPPSIRNENDKGEPNRDMNLSPNHPLSKTRMIRSNHVGNKELKSTDGVGNGVLTKIEIKKDDIGVPRGTQQRMEAE
ncbi:hypothetical protein Tco_0126522 [Tanacetum coccineum]